MMDETDLPALFDTMYNKEKMDKINFIIRCACEKLITFDEADAQIDTIIRAKDDPMRKWICDECGYIHESYEPPPVCPVCEEEK